MDGKNAASLTVAEQYINAFNKLASTNNTLILPSNVGDVSSLVGQAMSIYNTVSKTNQLNRTANDATTISEKEEIDSKPQETIQSDKPNTQ